MNKNPSRKMRKRMWYYWIQILQW